jgi:hypothetical protein
MLGPQAEEEPVFIVINEQGEEEEISQDRDWEYSSDAMRYIAPPEGEQ